MMTKPPEGSLKPPNKVNFIEAENSSGFHAPQEALRALGESINFARPGQLGLRPSSVASPGTASQR